MVVVETAPMAWIIRGMSRKDPECGNESLARYETTESAPRTAPHQPSVCSGHEPGFGVRRLADTSVGYIAARRGDVALNPSFARAVRSPPIGAEGGPKLAVEPFDIALRTASAVGVHRFFRCGAALRSLFGTIVIATLLCVANLPHHRLPRVERVNRGPASDVLSKATPTSGSSNSAASLEAQSVIEGWFVLRPPPPPVRESSTTLPIRILRVVHSQ